MKVVELFSGIGGFRHGLEAAGDFEVIYANDIDKFACQVYKANYQDDTLVEGDLKKIENFPEADLVVGGFPCPAFSMAGVSKRNSLQEEHGFEGKQGDLFFEVLRVMDIVSPEYVILENVKNLVYYDKGSAIKTIQEELMELGYYSKYQVINAAHYVPQKRERVFIVAFKNKSKWKQFEFPVRQGEFLPVKNILQKEADEFVLTDRMWQFLQEHQAKHKLKGHGFGYNIVDYDKPTATLPARYHKDGANILVPVEGKNPRKLSPLECERLMGFPDNWTKYSCTGKEMSNTRRYMMLGNALVPQIVEDIGKQIKSL